MKVFDINNPTVQSAYIAGVALVITGLLSFLAALVNMWGITRTKRMEVSLAKSQNRYKKLLQSAETLSQQVNLFQAQFVEHAAEVNSIIEEVRTIHEVMQELKKPKYDNSEKATVGNLIKSSFKRSKLSQGPNHPSVRVDVIITLAKTTDEWLTFQAPSLLFWFNYSTMYKPFWVTRLDGLDNLRAELKSLRGVFHEAFELLQEQLSSVEALIDLMIDYEVSEIEEMAEEFKLTEEDKLYFLSKESRLSEEDKIAWLADSFNGKAYDPEKLEAASSQVQTAALEFQKILLRYTK